MNEHKLNIISLIVCPKIFINCKTNIFHCQACLEKPPGLPDPALTILHPDVFTHIAQKEEQGGRVKTEKVGRSRDHACV